MGKRDKAKDLSPAEDFPPWALSGEEEELPLFIQSLKGSASLNEQIRTIHNAVVVDGGDETPSRMWIWLLQWMLHPPTPPAIRRTIAAKWSKGGTKMDAAETRRAVVVQSVYESVRLTPTSVTHSHKELDALCEFIAWWTKQKDAAMSLMTVSTVLAELSSILLTCWQSEPNLMEDVQRQKYIIRLATMTANVILAGQVDSTIVVEDGVVECFWEVLAIKDIASETSTTLALCYAKLKPAFVKELGSVENMHLRMSLAAAYAVTTPAAADDALAMLQTLCFDEVGSASDPDVRVLAWKGLRSLMERMPIIAWDEVLDLILSAWEHPPTRTLEMAIPPVFKLFQKRHPDPHHLIVRVLQQPLRSKGRYVALQYLVELLTNEQKTALTQELVAYLGDFSHAIVAVADLYGSLMVAGEFEADLARQLTAPSALSRRRQILAYALPKILASDQADISIKTLLQCIVDAPDDGRTIERETSGDRMAWCMLEVVRYAEKLILHHPECGSRPFNVCALCFILHRTRGRQ
jgi:hypothetical protein